MPAPTPKRAGQPPPEGAAFVADTLAANIRAIRRRRFWDLQYMAVGGDDLESQQVEDLEQEHVAARMRDRGHATWTRATVSQVERGQRNVTVPELLSLVLVLGASIGDLLDPHGARLALDLDGRVQVEAEDLEGLVCGHTVRATVEWRGAELVGVEFREVER